MINLPTFMGKLLSQWKRLQRQINLSRPEKAQRALALFSEKVWVQQGGGKHQSYANTCYTCSPCQKSLTWHSGQECGFHPYTQPGPSQPSFSCIRTPSIRPALCLTSQRSGRGIRNVDETKIPSTGPSLCDVRRTTRTWPRLG